MIEHIPSRLAKLRAMLRAREGRADYEKNCGEIRKQIAAIEKAPPPTDEEISEAWEIAALEIQTTASQDDPAVASETDKE